MKVMKIFEKVAMGLGVFCLIMLIFLLALEIMSNVIGGDPPIRVLHLVYETVYVEIAALIVTVIYFTWRKRKK